MLAPSLLFLLAGTHLPADAAPDPAKGASLLHECQAELRLIHLPSLDQAPAIDLIDGAYCVGYLNGFLSGLTRASICTKQESMGDLVTAYVSYMESHPDLHDQDKRTGLRLALESAYPCPATEQRSLPLQGDQRTGL